MVATERTSLLPHEARNAAVGNGSRLAQRVAVAALVVLSLMSSLALLRVSTLSSELLARLDKEYPRAVYMPAMSSSNYAMDAMENARRSEDDLTRVLIVYPNGTHLSKLARAVEHGVLQKVATPAQLRTRLVDEASFIDDVMWADAVILGSHVVNANVEPKMASFISSWVLSQDLSRKVGAAFVTGGGLSAGEELTMVNLLHSMMIFRMVIAGGELWTSAFGASGIVSEGPFQPAAQVNLKHQEFPTVCYPTNPDQLHDMFKAKAEGLGRRVVSIASLLRFHNE